MYETKKDYYSAIKKKVLLINTTWMNPKVLSKSSDDNFKNAYGMIPFT